VESLEFEPSGIDLYRRFFTIPVIFAVMAFRLLFIWLLSGMCLSIPGLMNIGSLHGESVETLSEVLPEAFEFEDGWFFDQRLGIFYPVPGTDWVIHRDLGILQIRPDGQGGFFLYQMGVGWLWSSREHFPYFFRYNLNSWGYWDPDSGDPPFYYYFELDQWVALELKDPLEGFGYAFSPSAEIDVLPETVDPPPVLSLDGPSSLHPGEAGIFTITSSLEESVEGVLFWGDGSSTSILQPGELIHQYDFPGTYEVILYHIGGYPQSEVHLVEVEKPEVPRVESMDLQYDFGTGPSGDRSTSFIGVDSAPEPSVTMTVSYTSPEETEATFSLEVTDPDGNVSSLGSEVATLSATGSTPALATVNFSPDFPTATEGVYTLQPQTDQAIAPDLPSPGTPLAYYANEIPDLEKACEEFRLTIMQKEAELAQKELDLENLLAALAELQNQLAEKLAECAELENLIADLEAEKDVADQEYLDAIDSFESRYPGWSLAIAEEGESIEDAQADAEEGLFPHLGDKPGPQLPSYTARGSGGNIAAFPTENGYQRDLGVFDFDADPSPLVYERKIRFDKDVSNAFWSRLDAIAEARKKAEEAADALSNAEAQLERCESEVADLEAAIADLESQIADCEGQIETIKAEIETLLVDAGECEAELRELVELERENRRALRELERELERLRKELEAAKNAAENTDEKIDEKAGNAGDLAADEEEIDEAQEELDDAEDDTDDAQNSANQAQAATNSGNPTQAQQFIQQARQKIQTARQKLQNGRSKTSTVRTRTHARPNRECEDGDFMEGTWSSPRFVATRVLDIGVSPQGETPEEWASKKEQGRELLDTIFGVLWVAGAIQDPLGTVKEEVTGQIGEEAKEALGAEEVVLTYDMEFMANLIYDSFLTLFEATRLMEIHVRLEGYRYRTRRNKLCVDGLWVLQPEEREITDEPYYKTKILGPVASGPPEERREHIENLISRYLRQLGLEPPGQ